MKLIKKFFSWFGANFDGIVFWANLVAFMVTGNVVFFLAAGFVGLGMEIKSVSNQVKELSNGKTKTEV